jgi:cell shape-determining protein MreD
MSLPLVLVLSWVAMGLETGLRDSLSLRGTAISPSFVLCLLVFIASFASEKHTRWTCVGLGLAMDMLSPVLLTTAAGEARIVGPHVLAFLLASQLVLQARSFMMRRNPVAIGVMCAAAAIITGLVLTTIYSLRAAMLDQMEWSALRDLTTRLGSAVYTGLVGILVAYALLPLAEWLGMSKTSAIMGRR